MAESTEIISEQISKQVEKSPESKLNTAIAIIVAIAASLVAIFNIKDNNIVQAMSQAQAHAIDAWSYYQAKSIKQHLVENNIENLSLMAELQGANKIAIEKLNKIISSNKEKVEKYEREKNEIKMQAEGFQKEYDDLNLHDDQFDLAEALISLGLTILGITALTQKWPLYFLGVGFCVLGIIFGLSGFLNLAIHPEWLTRILS